MTHLQVFYYLAIGFSIIFLIWNGMSFFGVDSDTDGMDINDIDGGSGVMGEFLTFRSLLNFLTFFGWFGILFLEQNYNPWMSVILASIGGFLMTFGFAALMFGFKKLQATPRDINTTDVVNQLAIDIWLFLVKIEKVKFNYPFEVH